MAETRGFEPPRPFNGPTSLAVRRTRPGYATSPSGGRSLQGKASGETLQKVAFIALRSHHCSVWKSSDIPPRAPQQLPLGRPHS